MFHRVKLLRNVLLGLVLSGCDSNLEVETKSAAILDDCIKNPTSKECQEIGNLFNLHILTDSFATNNPTVEVKWVRSDKAISYTLDISASPDCSNPIYTYDQFENHKTFDILSDGHYHICVEATLEDGTKKTADNNGLRISVDRIKPVIRKANSLPQAHQESVIQLDTSDMTSLTYQWSQTSGPGKVIFSNPADPDSKIKATQEGTYELKFSAIDAAGNAEEILIPFIWDTTPPSVDAGDDQSVNVTPVYLNATTELNAVNHNWSLVSGPEGSRVRMNTPQSKSTEAILDAYGKYVFKITAEDGAGNVGEDTVTVHLLNQSLTFTSIDLSGAATKGFVNLADTLGADGDLVANLVASGQTNTSYALSQGTCSEAAFTSNIPKTSDLSLLPDGTYKVCVKLEGSASSAVYGESSGFVKDTVPASAPTALNFSEGNYHRSKRVNASWTRSSSADVASQAIQYYRDGSCTTSVGDMVSKTSLQLTDGLTAPGEATYSFKITVTDAAGNISTSSCSAAIVIDLTPPAAPTALTWSGGSPTNSPPVSATWTLSVDGDVATQAVQYYADGACGVTFGDSVAKTGSNSTDNFNPIDGTYSFKVIATDPAGHSSASSCSNALVVDTTAPLGTIALSSNAAYYNSGTSPAIALSQTGGASEYQLCAVAATSGQNCGTIIRSWSAFTASPAVYDFSSDGVKTLYVQFRDTLGNISATYADSIEIDNTPPTGTIELSGGAAYHTADTSPTISLTESGQATQYQLCSVTATAGNDCAGVLRTWDTYSSSPASYDFASDGAKTLYVQFKDTAGNVSATTSDSVVIDTQIPSGTISLASGAAYYTSGTAPSITLTELGSPSSYQLCLDSASAGANCATVARSWAAYTASPAAYDFSTDGSKTLYVQFRDDAGNISATYSDAIEVDNAFPTGTIVLNGGSNTYDNAGDTSPAIALTEIGGATHYQLCLNSATQGLNCSSIARAWTVYTNAPTAYDFSTGGFKTLYVQFRDAAGNISATVSDDLTIVTNVASLTIASGASYYTSGTEPAISVQDDGAAAEFQLCADAATATNDCATPVLAWSAYPGAVPATYDFGSDGVQTLYVQFKTSGGDISATVSDSITIDNGAPGGTITLTSGQAYHTGDYAPTIALTETGSATHYQLCLNSALAGSNCSSIARSWASYTTSPASYDFGSDGSKTLYVQFRDAAGNISATFSDTITVDTQSPTGTITLSGGAAYHTADQSPGIALTESGSATHYQLCTDTATTGNSCSTPVVSWSAYTATPADYDFASEGTKNLYVQFRDAAGNISETYGDSIIVDTLDPSGSITLAGGSSYYSTDTSPPVSLTDSGNATHYQLCLNAAASGANCSSVALSWQAYTASPPAHNFGGDGTQTLYAQFRDAAGNISATVSDSVIVDTAVPSPVSISISGGSSYINSTSVTLSLGATDANGIQMYITNTAGCGSGGTYESFSSSKSWTLGQTESTATVYVKYQDAAGNESSCISDTIVHDETNPASHSISIDQGSYTSSSTIDLTLAATDTNLAQMYITNVAGCGSGGSWEAFSTSKSSWAHGVDDGTASVYVKFSDDAGNESTCVSDSIIHDDTDPASHSISIDQGTHTNSSTVDLTLSATDTHIYQMYITNVAGCGSGGTWESYGTSKSSWTHGVDDGNANIYAKFSDQAGNESTCVSDSIIHDDTAPTITSMAEASGGDGTYKDGETLTIDVNIDSTVDVAAGVTLSLDNGQTAACGTGSGVTKITCTYSISTAHSNTNALGVTGINNTAAVTDVSGNALSVTLPTGANALANESIAVDTASPSSTSLSIAGGATYIGTTSVTLTLGAPDSNSMQMYVTNTAGCGSGGTYEAYSSSKAWVLGQTESVATVYVKYRDAAGNESTCISDTIVHDNTDPASHTMSINQGAYTNASTIDLTLSATDTNLYQMYITNTAGCGSGGSWENYATSKSSWSHGVDDGTATVYVKFSDHAGNESTCISDSIIHDDTVPATHSISIDQGSYTSSSTVDLTLGATDTYLYQMYITNTAGCGSGGSWESYATSKAAWSHGVDDGTAAIYVKYSDQAGNESTCISDSIIHDDTNPSSHSISIDQGATTASSTVDLTLAATDANIYQMYVTNTAGCGSGGSWEAYSTSKTGWVHGAQETTATIYVKFSDQAGNESTCVSDSILHDTPNPTSVTSFEPLPGFTREGVSMSWVAGTNTTGYIIYRQDSGNGSISWTPTTFQSYTTGSNITGDSGSNSSSKIIYAGSDLSHTDKESLLDNRTYIYKIFAHNSVYEYDAGVDRLSRTYPYHTIDVGNFNSCATKFGRVRCWGANYDGQLGYGDTTVIGDDESPFEKGDVPVGVDVLAARVGTSEVTIGGHICALTVEGRVRCWGEGFSGKTGHNNSTNTSSPGSDLSLEQSSGVPATIIMVDTGAHHTCVITNRGKVRCFGNGSDGALGYNSAVNLGDGGSEMQNLADVSLPGDPTIAEVKAGYFNTCVVTTENKGRCWGRNAKGELGQDSSLTSIGSSGSGMSTIDDIGVGDIKSISTHLQTTCAVTASNAVRCWGYCYRGKCGYANETDLGDGTTSVSNAIDIDIDATDDYIVEDVMVSGVSTCILNTSGQVKCWGENYGQAGYGDNTLVGFSDHPSVRGWHDFGSKVVQIAGGAYDWTAAHICALTETGEVYCWGEAGNGALGHESTVDIGDDEPASDIAPIAVWGPVQATPDSIRPGNLIAWIDAADASMVYSSSDCSSTLASDGDTVGCVKDKSSNSNHASMSTSANRPTWVQSYSHGHHSLRFNGSSTGLTGFLTGYTGGDSDFTMFVVYKSESPTQTSQLIFAAGTAAVNSAIGIVDNYPSPGTMHLYNWDNDVNYPTDTGSREDQTILSYNYVGGGATTSNKKYYSNGVQMSHSGTSGGNYGSSLTMANGPEFTIGGEASWSAYFKGVISEVIFYDTTLTDTERHAVEAYLRAKWQKGVDGIATAGLGAHYDAMKAATTTTDSCGTFATPATNGELVQCWQDRSGNENHVEQTTSGSRPSLVSSNSDMGGGRSVHFQSDNLSKSSSTGLSVGDEPWHIGLMLDMDSSISTGEGPLGIGHGLDNQEYGMHSYSSVLLVGGDNNAQEYNSSQVSSFLSGSGSFTLSMDYPGGAVDTSLHLDGMAKSKSADSNWGSFSIPNQPAVLLGGRAGGVDLLNNDHLSEVFVYKRSLSKTEQDENDRYFMKKWGQTNDNTKAPGGVDHGLSLWLDASDSSTLFQDGCSTALTAANTDSDLVRCWKDKSGLENHVEASSSDEATYKTNQFNGRSVLSFDGSSFLGTLPQFNGNQPYTIFIVEKPRVWASWRHILSIGHGTTVIEVINLEYHSTEGRIRHGHQGVPLDYNNGAPLGQVYVGTHTYNGVDLSVANKDTFRDGLKLSTSSNGSAVALNLPSTPLLAVGSRSDGNMTAQTDIAEVVIYDRLLSSPERQDVEAYLSQKWLDESVYTDCMSAEDRGETVDGTFTMDRDGYNGPLAPYSAACDFSPYSNLVAWWKLDEASGSTALDSAGSNHGSHTNIAAADIGNEGLFDKAVTFDGSNDYIVATGYKGITGTADRSVSAWVKTTDTDGGILSYGVTTNSQKWTFRIKLSQIRLEVQGNGITGSTNIADGRWHHVAVTFANDGSPDVLDAKLYVDGVEETWSESGSQSINTSAANDVRIGRDRNDRYLNGALDDVRLYDKALSASEILDLFNQGKH